MHTLRLIRYGLWALVAVAIAGFGYFALRSADVRQNEAAAVAATIGGPFTLVDQRGNTVTEAALKGQPSFFGYTFCPDVCPTSLAEASDWLKQLGPDGDKVKIYFVTVDPEHDTQQQLASYLSAFDLRIVGLTGSPEAVEEMLAAYRVFRRKAPQQGGGYLMDHTSSFYLLDADAVLVGAISYGEAEADALAKIRRAIAQA